MLSEQTIWKKNVYVHFIGYTKAFDRIGHEALLETLGKLDLYKKDIWIICKLYWEQTACIWIENEFSKYTK